jgi:hypothetical protein
MIRPSARPRFSKFCAGGAVVLALTLAGCGEPYRPAPAADPPSGASEDEAGAHVVLTRLYARVSAGTGLADAEWGRDVTELATLLWRVQLTDTAPIAARDHLRLTNVAGDVGRDLARAPDGRTRWAQSDPVSLEIHAAWLVAAQGAPDVYRAWVEGAGAALAQRLREARAKLFDRR